MSAIDDPRRRSDAHAVAALMSEITGEPAVLWGSSIVGFGNDGGPKGGWPLISFSPRKANLVLYAAVDFSERAELIARLGKVKTGVGCLYVSRLEDVDQAVLRDLCGRAVRAVKAGLH
ncbi:hypothetical protein ABIC32_000186 [Brevundimonas sp. 1080]|uniref:DUF1801 domain-containing protein n=1 Tax=Brevundimonas sp. 1080 TaxID=3156405 RepID=UPI003390E7A5